jgi:hypothetical protein
LQVNFNKLKIILNIIKSCYKLFPIFLCVILFNITYNTDYYFFGGDFNEHLNSNYYEYISKPWDLREFGFYNRQFAEYLFLKSFYYLNVDYLISLNRFTVNLFLIGSYFSFLTSISILKNKYIHSLKIEFYIFSLLYIFNLYTFKY